MLQANIQDLKKANEGNSSSYSDKSALLTAYAYVCLGTWGHSTKQTNGEFGVIIIPTTELIKSRTAMQVILKNALTL